MRLLALAAALWFVTSHEVSAAPLNLTQVPADARFVVLVDVDGIRTADGWRQLHEQFWSQNKFVLGPILDAAGLDLKDGLHGVTIYATRVATEKDAADFRGAGIVALDFDREKLIRKLKSLEGDKPVSHGPHEIYRWQASAEGKNEPKLGIAVHSSKVLVVSTSIGEIEHALDVLDGKEANITQSDSALAMAVPLGSLILARALDLEQVASQFESPLLKQCKSLSLAIGNRDDQFFADGQAWLKSTDTAEQIETLFNGFRALVQLQAGSQEDVAKWLGKVRCVRNDKVVTLSLRLPASELQVIFKRGGKIELDSKAAAKVKIDVAPSEAKAPKPGIGVQYNVGVQFGTQPPAAKPKDESKKAEKSEKADESEKADGAEKEDK
jgi:hypothetical protein